MVIIIKYSRFFYITKIRRGIFDLKPFIWLHLIIYVIFGNKLRPPISDWFGFAEMERDDAIVFFSPPICQFDLKSIDAALSLSALEFTIHPALGMALNWMWVSSVLKGTHQIDNKQVVWHCMVKLSVSNNCSFPAGLWNKVQRLWRFDCKLIHIKIDL